MIPPVRPLLLPFDPIYCRPLSAKLYSQEPKRSISWIAAF